MTTDGTNPAMRHLSRAAILPDGADLTDAELLGHYVRRRDETAFAALLRRHGPMVLGVCRRVLGNEADAADAFQATFLVLVRKAGSIRARGLVGNWLYGVAHNTARKAKAMNRKRQAKERDAAAVPKPGADGEDWEQVLPLLDAELSRLPDHYRVPIVLCDLEGRTIKETARHLGWPLGTAATRLTRGRALLARRLTGRGLALSGSVLAAGLAPKVASADVPAPLLGATLRASVPVAAGTAVGAVVSARVSVLVEGVLKMMLLTKLKTALAFTLLVAVVGTGWTAWSLATAAPAARRAPVATVAVASAEPRREAPQPPQAGSVALNSDQVVALAFSPDSKFLAGGCMDGKVRLWDAKTNELRKTLEGPKGVARTVAFSPDGQTLAAGADDGGIHLWDVATWKPQGVLEDTPAYVTGLAFLPDGRLAAAYNRGGQEQQKCQIKLWDVRAKKAELLYGQMGGTYGLARSPDGALLAATLDGEFHGLRVWDLRTGKAAWEKAAPGFMADVAFAPDGKSLAVGGGQSIDLVEDGIVYRKAYRTVGRLWCFDVATRRQLWVAEAGQDRFSKVAFTADSKGILTGGSGPIREYGSLQKVVSELRRWDAATGQRGWRTEGELGQFFAIAAAPDGGTLAGCDDEQLMTFDPATGKLRQVLFKRTLTPIAP
jgi:RNA polymerase sigma factor (sigma-70 family)